MENSSLSPPFSKGHQLCHDYDQGLAGLPVQPSVSLTNSNALTHFLVQEYCARDLESVASHLWILTTQSSANVSSLHRQKVKGRDIVVTEDPRLHLVWINDRIFIKPLPSYLLSHEFWDKHLISSASPQGSSQREIRKAALGYLRTYHYLIKHKSDLRIAQEEHLQLVSPQVSWTDFCHFTSDLGRIRDADVSNRYHYGELRLSRLNLYAPILWHRFYYEQVHGQYGDYFAQLYGPIFFIFAVVSTLLNAMQVAIGADGAIRSSYLELWTVFYWFSIVSLLITILIAGFFGLLWLWMVADEWIYALKVRRRKRADTSIEAQK